MAQGGRAPAAEAWQPEFGPGTHDDGMRELTPLSCPLTSRHSWTELLYDPVSSLPDPVPGGKWEISVHQLTVDLPTAGKRLSVEEQVCVCNMETLWWQLALEGNQYILILALLWTNLESFLFDEGRQKQKHLEFHLCEIFGVGSSIPGSNWGKLLILLV